MEPTLRLPVENAAWIGNGRAKLKGILCAVNGRSVTVEAVEVDGIGHRVPGSVIDTQNIVERLQHKAIAYAEALIGRFDRKLISSAGHKALLKVIQRINRQCQFWIGLGFSVPPM